MDIVRVEAYGGLPVSMYVLHRTALYCTVVECVVVDCTVLTDCTVQVNPENRSLAALAIGVFDSDLSAKQESKVSGKVKKQRQAKHTADLSAPLLNFLQLLDPEVERSRAIASKFKVSHTHTQPKPV